MGYIKYSIIMPYFDRHKLLEETLSSLEYFYSYRNDWEVVIVEDNKQTYEMRFNLLKLIESFKDKMNIIHIRNKQTKIKYYNPSISFNEGVEAANGFYVLITNPECRHEVDILKGLDFEFLCNQNLYVVCSCVSLKQDGSFNMWYQHSKKRNLKYHFCTAMLKDNYKRIGGFNEEYAKGFAYDDDSFRDRVINYGLKFSIRDDLKVTHLWHSKQRPFGYKKLLEINRKLYENEKISFKNKIIKES